MTRLDHSTPWRYECPRGHTMVRQTSVGLHCKTCSKDYDGGRIPFVRDKKRDEKVMA